MSKKDQFINEYIELCRKYGCIVAQHFKSDKEYSPFSVMRIKKSDLDRAMTTIKIECMMEPVSKLIWPFHE